MVSELLVDSPASQTFAVFLLVVICEITYFQNIFAIPIVSNPAGCLIGDIMTSAFVKKHINITVLYECDSPQYGWLLTSHVKQSLLNRQHSTKDLTKPDKYWNNKLNELQLNTTENPILATQSVCLPSFQCPA